MQQTVSGSMPSARSTSHPSPGSSLGPMATPCFQVPEESSAQICMGLISGRLPPSPNLRTHCQMLARDGWKAGRVSARKGAAQVPKMASSKDEA